MNRRRAADIRYLIRLEPGVQLPEETLAKASGSCRDSAALLVNLLRHLGLAARFVSGCLIQLVADVKALDGPAGPSSDFTDLHAWCEVYLPGAGWIGLDPTSGLLAGEGHIPLACSPEPATAAPITGAVDECETQFEHSMSVQRIWEAPRVTKPYSDAQWNEILRTSTLIGAVRARRVVIANGLGSGVLESAAWMGFMPAIAEPLLGERLTLPSVATWWCGETPALDYVLSHLERLVIKPAYPNQRFDAVFGRDLNEAQRESLRERIRARPYVYVAQEHLAFSQAPVWRAKGDGGFSARAMGMRVYAIAGPNGYQVMPGALARIASDSSADVVSMQRGGGSKDVWVLSAAPEAIEESPLRPAAGLPILRAATRHDDLPSSLVENLFWMGRYCERCEYKARLARASASLRRGSPLWRIAVALCEHFAAYAAFDAENPLSLHADLARLGACAAQARSRLSAENWRVVSVLQREFEDAAAAREDVGESYDRLLLSLAALAGFALDDMTQDDGWRMMMIGRRLERLQFLAELLALRVKAAEAPAQQELEWLLDIGDSTITYRTRYLSAPRLDSVIDLLVFDQTNPRALAFQWQWIDHALVRIAVSVGGVADDTLDAAVTDLLDCEGRCCEGASEAALSARTELSAALNRLSAAAQLLSDRIALQHFSHVSSNLRMVAA